MPGNNIKEQARRDSQGLFVFRPKIRTIVSTALDLIFPPLCTGCDRVDWRWCPRCQSELENIPVELIYSPYGKRSIASTGLHSHKLQQAIHSLKYENATHIADTLGNRLVKALEQLNWKINVVIPVPISAARLNQRGYNQSNLLAEKIVEHTGIHCDEKALIRIRETRPQVGLNQKQRLANVSGAFSTSHDLTGYSVLIIDDVLTTGATLMACAKAVKDAGAAAIYGLTVTAAVDHRS